MAWQARGLVRKGGCAAAAPQGQARPDSCSNLGSKFWGKNSVCAGSQLGQQAARTHNRATVCLHEAHLAALREFWTGWLWLATETPFLHDRKTSSLGWSHADLAGTGARERKGGVLGSTARCTAACL